MKTPLEAHQAPPGASPRLAAATESDATWHQRRHARLFAALAEDVARLGDEATLADWAEDGDEALATAARLRTRLRLAVKDERQRRLRDAAAEYERVRQAMHGRWLDMPETADGRRALLTTLLQRDARAQAAFSYQNRDFSALSDDDVESLLVQLGTLGVDLRVGRGDGADDPERSG
jgi:hypothetical protein